MQIQGWEHSDAFAAPLKEDKSTTLGGELWAASQSPDELGKWSIRPICMVFWEENANWRLVTHLCNLIPTFSSPPPNSWLCNRWWWVKLEVVVTAYQHLWFFPHLPTQLHCQIFLISPYTFPPFHGSNREKGTYPRREKIVNIPFWSVFNKYKILCCLPKKSLLI